MKNYTGRAIAILALSVVFSIAGCSGQKEVVDTQAGASLTPGQKFTLKNLNGEDVRLEDQLKAHQAVLLNFWATWCAYCVEEMPDLIKFQAENSSKGFTIIGVNAGESQDQVAPFVKKMELNFPVVLDEEMDVAQQYGLVGIPTSILINSEGKIIGKYNSFSRRLQSDVAKVLEQNNV